MNPRINTVTTCPSMFETVSDRCAPVYGPHAALPPTLVTGTMAEGSLQSPGGGPGRGIEASKTTAAGIQFVGLDTSPGATLEEGGGGRGPPEGGGDAVNYGHPRPWEPVTRWFDSDDFQSGSVLGGNTERDPTTLGFGIVGDDQRFVWD